MMETQGMAAPQGWLITFREHSDSQTPLLCSRTQWVAKCHKRRLIDASWVPIHVKNKIYLDRRDPDFPGGPHWHQYFTGELEKSDKFFHDLLEYKLLYNPVELW